MAVPRVPDHETDAPLSQGCSSERKAQRPDTESCLLHVKVLYLGQPPNNGLPTRSPVLVKLYPFKGQGKLSCKVIFTSTLRDIRPLFYLHLDAGNPLYPLLSSRRSEMDLSLTRGPGGARWAGGEGGNINKKTDLRPRGPALREVGRGPGKPCLAPHFTITPRNSRSTIEAEGSLR